MNQTHTLSRRKTLEGLAALATIQVVPSHVIGANGKKPPSEQITRGIIGLSLIHI